MPGAEFDIVIAGLGAHGSSALLAAARAGARVLGLDRYAPPHAFGSSHGETRIVREAIGEGHAFTPLAVRSMKLWSDLERKSARRLLSRTGLIVLPGQDHAGMHIRGDFLDTTISAAMSAGIPHEVLETPAVRARFPAFANAEGPAYFEPGAGFAFPERIIETQITAARDLGASVKFGDPVVGVHPARGGGLIIETATEKLRAASAVLCLGAYIHPFLPAEWQARLTVSRQILHWVDAAPYADFVPDRMPAFIWDRLYGFPAIDGREGGFKVATENLADLADPMAPRRPASADEITAFLALVRAQFPGVRRTLRTQTCLYTSTKDFNFLIDRHPEMEDLTIVSACSGHGFKHAAAIGEAVALEALGHKAPVDLTPFRATLPA